MIDPTGSQAELSCFEHDNNTQLFLSCSVSWQNQMIIFGGRMRTRQVSRLDGYRLNRIGNLSFDHEDGTCTVMNDEIYLCFSSNWPLNDASESFLCFILATF